MNTVPLTQRMVLDALRQVTDPEVGLSIVDMGLIYDVSIDNQKVTVKMTLTTPGCPMSHSMVYGVRSALKRLPPVQEVEVELVWEPPWSPAMMTPEGQAQVGMC